jgi:hypothetical protein
LPSGTIVLLAIFEDIKPLALEILETWRVGKAQQMAGGKYRLAVSKGVNSGRSQLSCFEAGLLKEFALPLSIFASKDVRAFTIVNGIHEQASSRQKASGQDTNGKKANPRQEDSP